MPESKLARILQWFFGVVNGRIDCPKCGAKKTGVLLGEWDGEMRECHKCKHYWFFSTAVTR